ncbi:MAG: hypothetical protein GX286_02375 [Clostridiales bacterium]|jgi:hypothetical protein|nr:hypothetical protein [Clostridiales bacterium]
MKKAVILGLCLAGICCSFTGCGNDDDTTNNARNDNGVVDRALNNAETVVSDAVRGAETLADDIVRGVETAIR